MDGKQYYGKETEKALHSFGKGQIPRPLIRAYGEVKKAAIMAQQEAERLYSPDDYIRIIEAADKIISGKMDDQFPLPLKQGGAGTSLHMNICEVLANLSGVTELHPLEDLARFQSTNDTFPTAVIVMVYRFLADIEESVIGLQEYLVRSEEKYSSLLMTGRTELQDALPITLGQVFASWAGPFERDRWRLHKLKERLRTVPLGGTALGTCFSAPRQYVFKAEQNLRKVTGLPLCRSQNLTDAVASQDSLAEAAAGLRLVALNLKKMAGDLLLYTSSLSGELEHGERQFGSTIMPFKSNPVILEFVSGLSVSIKHRCSAIEDYAAAGQLQLNAYLPFIADAFISVHFMMKESIGALLERFFPEMKIHEDKIESNLAASPAMVNALRPVLGYGKVKELAELIKLKQPKNLDEVKKIIISGSDLSKDFLDRWMDPSGITSFTERSMNKNGNSTC